MSHVTYTFKTGDEAEAFVTRLAQLLMRYGYFSLGDVKSMLGLKSTNVNEKWGWITLEGIHHHPTPGGEELVFPPAVALEDEELSVEPKEDVKFQHVMPAELAADLDRLAAKMGTSRRGLMNVLLYQTIRNQPYN